MTATKVFLNAKELHGVTGLSRTTVWRLETAGDFPRRRQVTAQRVAWLAEEVLAWCRSRPLADPEVPLTEVDPSVSALEGGVP